MMTWLIMSCRINSNRLWRTNIQQFSVQALNEASTTGNLFSTITSDGASYTTGGFTLLDGKGEKIGVVVVIHDVTEQIQEIQQTLLSLILIAFVITLIIAVLLIARSIQSL